MVEKKNPRFDNSTRQGYRDAVNAVALPRVRIFTLFGSGLYVAFSVLDHIVYPAQASLFLSVRILVSSIVVTFFLGTYFRTVRRYATWVGNVGIFLAGAGILFMIYTVPDRVTSNYYQGLYAILLGMFVMNSFDVKQNFVTGLLIVGGYLGVVSSGFKTHTSAVVSAGFFLATIYVMLLLLTEIYNRQFLSEFIKSGQLKTANEELKHTQEFLRSLSMHDELTKLHNRRGFMILADEQLKLARRHKADLLVFFADMDGLKSVNDRYGHAMGDRAIQTIAQVLQKTFRASDIVARFAGDEFAMLSVNAAWGSENIILARLQENLRAVNNLGGLPFPVNLSVGTCRFEVGSGLTIENLMEKADAKLYELKRNKR